MRRWAAAALLVVVALYAGASGQWALAGAVALRRADDRAEAGDDLERLALLDEARELAAQLGDEDGPWQAEADRMLGDADHRGLA